MNSAPDMLVLEQHADASDTPTARPDATGTGRHCLLVWSLLLLLPLALVLAIGLPWWQRMQALDAQIDTSRDQLQRLQRMVATLPALRAELAREQANDDFKAFYFDAATPALAGAQIQRQVQEMVNGVGARLISAQVLPVNPADQPPRVPLRIQLQGDTDQLLEVLYQIEDARPFLFVDQMSIRSMAQPNRRAVPARIRNRPGVRVPNQPTVGELTVRLDLFGFVLAPGNRPTDLAPN